MKILNLDQIKQALKSIDIISEIEKGFVAYSSGLAVIPPIGELQFENPRGDVHIKYGYIRDNDYYVIKVASGFYDNPKINLPSSNGLMLLFSQTTGELLAILLDEGYLTDLRTAAAGAIVAKYLAPSHITRIGMVGTGIQAKLQLLYLKLITDCRDVIVWGRSLENLHKFRTELEQEGFSLQITQKIEDITSSCNLIVTTTPAVSPLLWAKQIKRGTHITAVGADSINKQEIDSNIFKVADLVVADSIEQCVQRGDIAHAIKAGVIKSDMICELGNVISGVSPKRTNEDQITIADLTGVAVQDIAIAKAVFEAKIS